jgi:RNA polymerase sigma-70 factor (ECF subfamily)
MDEWTSSTSSDATSAGSMPFLRTVGRPAEAEELAQETFVRACGAALRFRGDSSVRTWLFGIAHRVLLEASRAGVFERSPSVEDRADDAPGVSTEERIDLERALGALPPTDREVLVMVDVLGFEPSVAAAVAGVSPDTYRVRLHRARRRLRGVYRDA